MTDFILSVKKSLQSASSPFSIFPETDYKRHVPQNAEQLMHNNWLKTGGSLQKAIDKVGENIEKR